MWLLAVSRYNTARAAIWHKAGVRSRYKICIMTRRGLRHGVVSRYRQRHGHASARHRATIRPLGLRHCRPQGCDTAGARPRHDPTRAACERGLSALRTPWAHHARSQGQLCVHTVHLTYFWTQCIVSVTVWDTVHEHCS